MQKITRKLFFVLSLALLSMAGYSQATADMSESLVIYPNPSTTGYFNVQLKNSGVAPGTISVYSIIGEVIKEEMSNDLSQKTQLDLTALPEGNYFLHVSNGESYTSRKISINK